MAASSSALSQPSGPPFREPLLDSKGNMTRPWVSFFVELAAGGRFPAGAHTVVLEGDSALIDLGNGLNQEITLPKDKVIAIQNPTGTLGPGDLLNIVLIQLGGGGTVTWGDKYLGVSDTVLDATDGTYSAFTFYEQADGSFRATSWMTGRINK